MTQRTQDRRAVVEAVLLLFDDPNHTFQDVTHALELLGIAPPAALSLTQVVNDMGLNIVSKGSVEQVERAAATMAAFNTSVVRTAAVDAAVAAARGLRSPVLQVDASPRCPMWALAGACTRQPLFMYTRCEPSCLTLGPYYLQAAMARPALPLVHMVAEQLGLLGVVLLAASISTDALFVDAKRGPRRRAAALRLATALLALHFLVDGFHGIYLAASAPGFVLKQPTSNPLAKLAPPLSGILASPPSPTSHLVLAASSPSDLPLLPRVTGARR